MFPERKQSVKITAARHVLVLTMLFGAAEAFAGKIVFVRGAEILEAGDDGKAEPTRIATLPEGAGEVLFLRWRAGILVGQREAGSFWMAGADGAGGACAAVASASPTGKCVACDGKFWSADGKNWAPMKVEGRDVAFRADDGRRMVALRDEGVVGWDWKTPATIETLTAAGPTSHLMVAPDGERAVAVYGTGVTSRIKSFLLDGKGVARVLGGPGVPLAWSADSQWVLTQEGIDPNEGLDDDDGGEGALLLERGVMAAPAKGKKAARPAAKPKKKEPPPPPPAPRTRVCAVRATGGEAKCWDDYIGMAFSPDSTLVLMKKGNALYVGKIAGVRPEPPVRRLENVDGAATWVE